MDDPQLFVVGPDDEPDKYHLRRQISIGGEAELWEADVGLAGQRERVAIKILRPELASDPQWRARWAEQVELLRLVQHPGIVGVHAYFEGARMHRPGQAADQRDRAIYLVMNWVDGEDLRAWVPQHRSPADLAAALRLLEQVAAVLDRLHSGQATPSNRPVVHGDLSPANVVVNRDGQAVLVDFGLFRMAQHTTQVPAGTRGYTAPEAIAHGQYSPASDRYAFGGLAYYVLTGSHPSPDPEAMRAESATLGGYANQPVTSGELAAIFSADPAQRPSAGAWIRLLRSQSTATAPLAPAPGASATTLGASAAPAGGGRRSRKWLAAVGAGALAGVLALGIAVGASLFGPDQPPATNSGAGTPATGGPVAPGTSLTPAGTGSPTGLAPAPAPSSPEQPPTSSAVPSWPGEPAGTTFITGTVGICADGFPCRGTFDLDTNRARTRSSDERDVSATEDGLGAHNGARFAPWEESSVPNLRDCRELPEEAWAVPFIEAVEFEAGAIYCVQTNLSRYGYLNAQRVESNSGSPWKFHFYYLLWASPQDT